MGDKLRLHVLLRVRLGLGCMDIIRLQHGVWRTVVSVPRQTGIGDFCHVPHRPGDDTGSGLRHAGSDLPNGYPDLFPVRVRCDHGDHSRGSVLGRMNFAAWVVFCPVWMTLVYTVGAFSLWGGGWLSQLGVQDFSGGYVIHLAAGTSGFVAAAVVGPRLRADREQFPPNSLLVALIGAGLLWLGWNGFNGGDPYFANHDAGTAVLNTNTATAVGLLVWTLMDKMAYGKPSIIGAVNGMIAGLVAITPAAGFVNGWGAIIIGIAAGIIPWASMNKFQKTNFMMKVKDTLGVFSTHGIAGLTGGLLVGILACPDMLEYIGTEKDAPGVSVTGLLYGDTGNQLLLQLAGAAFIIVFNAIATFVILKVISIFVPLRMADAQLAVGDDAVHGETAYAITVGEAAE